MHVGRQAEHHSPQVALSGVARRHWRTPPVVVVMLGLLLALGMLLPVGPIGQLIPTASAHALLVRSDPAADQILKAPPGEVRMWFSEDLNPLTSKAVVIDTTNREVDNKDSHVNPNDSREMDVSLPLLPAGTYIVDWRTQSAVDGHVVGGSFIFRIARPDGSVPPVPAVLPTGHIPGAAGSGVPGSSGLDGPTTLQSLATWLALLFLAFWVGGLIWETWILSTDSARDSALAHAARLAQKRFQMLAPYALILLVVADVGIVLGQSAELAGDWSGAFTPVLLRAVLFGSRFGTFWWMREIVAVAALVLIQLAQQFKWPEHRGGSTSVQGQEADAAEANAGGSEPAEYAPIPDWRREVLVVLRGVPRLPRRLVRGVRQRPWVGRLELVLAAALLVAFALSGHAAAVPADERTYALSVDLLHLLGNAAWVGGLLYIGVVLIPVLGGLSARQRARVLALGLPEFSVVAIVSAATLAISGMLNTTLHLTSIEQFLTTSYGLTLAVKIELFLVMVAISAYHAFYLRPRLVRALAETAPHAVIETSRTPQEALSGIAGTPVGGKSDWRSGDPEEVRPGDGSERPAPDSADADGDRNGPREGGISSGAQRLARRLEEWVQREAVLGAAVLLCVALLAAFAGSLAPAPGGAPAAGGQSSGPFTQTHTVSGYAITLKVDPATFGTNTFTVTVKDAKGQPVDGGSVLIQTNMLDMDMGVQNVQLKAQGASAPGTYAGQSDLTMAGHWSATVKVLPPKSKQFVTTEFKFSASY